MQKLYFKPKFANFMLKLGGWHFFGRGVPNLQKVGVDKTATSLFRQQKHFMTSHHRYTFPPKKAKIVSKSVFLNKINIAIFRLMIPCEGEALSSECYSKRSRPVLSNF